MGYSHLEGQGLLYRTGPTLRDGSHLQDVGNSTGQMTTAGCRQLWDMGAIKADPIASDRQLALSTPIVCVPKDLLEPPPLLLST